jgi:1-acyl-sn-glycerol-3-phosphate acyltransferase
MKPIYRAGHTGCSILAQLLFRFRVIGRENFNVEGPAIIAANHQSYLDPPLIGVAYPGELHYLARNTLFENRLFNWILTEVNAIPVDRDRGDVGAIRAVLKLLKDGHRTVIFPEGTRTLTGQIQKARPGLGMIVAKTLVPVIPARIFGSFESWPKNGKLKPHPITVIIGKPIRFTSEDVASGEREIYQKISERILGEIAKLEMPSP